MRFGSFANPAVHRQVYDFGIQWAYYLDWDLYVAGIVLDRPGAVAFNLFRV